MESNPYTIQELINFIHKETSETMVVTPRMLENWGIHYSSCMLTHQKVEVYVFLLQDGIYLYRKNNGINFLNMTKLEKLTPEDLDAVVERKESMEEERKALLEEEKTLEMILNHPSQRLRKLYSKKTN